MCWDCSLTGCLGAGGAGHPQSFAGSSYAGCTLPTQQSHSVGIFRLTCYLTSLEAGESVQQGTVWDLSCGPGAMTLHCSVSV